MPRQIVADSCDESPRWDPPHRYGLMATPITTAARISAVFEATVGQSLIGVLVARLMGLQVSQEGGE